MNKASLALATGCAVIGAAVTTLVVPAGADQVGSPAGGVTILSPSVRPGDTSATREVFPRFTTSGNVEAGTSSLTVKKGTTVIASNATTPVTLAKGTYTVTTKVNYRYTTFRQQNVQVVTDGAPLNKIVDKDRDDGSGNGPAQSVQPGCKVSEVDAIAKTFSANCTVRYERTAYDPASDELTVTPVTLGTMAFSGTYSGETAHQDGFAGSELTIDPTVGGTVFGDIHATKSFYLPFYGKESGTNRLVSKTATVTIDKTVG